MQASRMSSAGKINNRSLARGSFDNFLSSLWVKHFKSCTTSFASLSNCLMENLKQIMVKNTKLSPRILGMKKLTFCSRNDQLAFESFCSKSLLRFVLVFGKNQFSLNVSSPTTALRENFSRTVSIFVLNAWTRSQLLFAACRSTDTVCPRRDVCTTRRKQPKFYWADLAKLCHEMDCLSES